MRLLFVCNQNRNRSVAAAELFASEHETRSAGIYGGNIVTNDDIDWADVTIVMEDEQRRWIAENLPRAYLNARIITLGIPDIYDRTAVELQRMLVDRVTAALQ